MSVMGTGPAAGVAQTQHQASQAQQERAREARQAQNNAERAKRIFQMRLLGLEELDETPESQHLHADGQQTGMPHQAAEESHNPRARSAEQEADQDETPDAPDEDEPRQHIDLEA